MIHKFREYNKFQEYFSKSYETIFACIATVVVVATMICLQFSVYFNEYISVVNSIINTLIAGFMGILALALAGIAFWGTFIDDEFTEKLVRYCNDEQVRDKLFISYMFLIHNIIIFFVVSIVMLFIINSNKPVLSTVPFYIVTIAYLYITFFIIGYTAALIKNSIDLIDIKSGNISVNSKSTLDRANELRIDYILEILYRFKSDQQTHDHLLDELNKRVDLGEYSKDEKEKLKEYFRSYYSSEEYK